MTKIQKTFLALLATATAFSASAEGSKEGNFYLGAGLGGFMQQSKIFEETTFTKVKKPDLVFDTSAGVGYYVTDSVRVELAFAKPFLGKTKRTTTMNDEVQEVETSKIKVNSLQIRTYTDLFDISDFGKVYAGAGIGLSHTSGKLAWEAQNTNKTVREASGLATSGSVKFKKGFSISYGLAAGAEFDVADSVKLGAEYNFNYHGKAVIKDVDGLRSGIYGHSILAKLRFDI